MTDYLGSVALPSMKQRQKKLCQVKMKARVEPVYNDSSNIGVRMLEKLGWSEGKGLGKREDGMSAPILPKMKQDSEGFGYAGEKDDHWTQHDQDFNQLLKSLNGGGGPEGEEGADEVDLAKMKSLEEKSKNSRARVHYKKFTRGKDLSRASEKDLANIFGKKSLEEVKNQIVGEVVEPAEVEEEVEPSEERNILGLTTINATVSVQDYFKKKMQEKLGKVVAPVEPVPEEPERKKSKKSKRKHEDPEIEQEPELEVEQEPEELPKKKKKRSKNEELEAEIVQEVDETPKKKSKKDKRKQTEEAQEIVQEQSSLEQLEEPVERKSKKGKRKASEDNEETATEIVEEASSLEQIDEPPTKKSKKKKRKQSQDEQPVEVETEEVSETPSAEGKKSEKKKKASPEVEKEEQQQQNGTAAAADDDDDVTCRVKVSVLKQLDEHCFAGSNFADIVGYGLTQDVKLVRREGRTKHTLEKHQFVRQKQTSAHRKRQMLKKVSAFKGI